MRIVGRWSTSRALALAVLVAGSVVLFMLSGCGPSPTATPTSPPSGPPGPSAEALTPAPEPDVSAYSFSSISFSEPASQYKSRWNLRVKSNTVSLVGGGLHADIAAGAGDKSQYAGVKFPAAAPNALKLTLTFTKPDGINVFYVDGYAAGAKPGRHTLRWEWRNTKGKKIPAGTATYVLVPGKDSAYFTAGGGADASAVADIDVFAMVRPGMTVGYTIDRVEVGK